MFKKLCCSSTIVDFTALFLKNSYCRIVCTTIFVKVAKRIHTFSISHTLFQILSLGLVYTYCLLKFQDSSFKNGHFRIICYFSYFLQVNLFLYPLTLSISSGFSSCIKFSEVQTPSPLCLWPQKNKKIWGINRRSLVWYGFLWVTAWYCLYVIPGEVWGF